MSQQPRTQTTLTDFEVKMWNTVRMLWQNNINKNKCNPLLDNLPSSATKLAAGGYTLDGAGCLLTGGLSYSLSPASHFITCRHVMHARHSVSVKLSTLKFHAGLRFKKNIEKTNSTKQKGASLRITPIWLFYPLAQQRTKCIDGSAMAPPVSGMYFTHQFGREKHSASWSSS